MKVNGIVAEYNPFHKGHKYHIDSTIKATGDNIVAIISGNFVQRGEPALLKKHIRAKMALLNGVSMVLELPVEYATGSADVFAFGAVNILNDKEKLASIKKIIIQSNNDHYLLRKEMKKRG